MSGKKKVVFDMALNIVAVAIPTVTLQLIILPWISNYTDSESYGLMVTILALMNTIPSTIGNVLNNVRLLHRSNSNGEDGGGDVTILLLFLELANFIFLIIVSGVYFGFKDLGSIILTVIIGILWLSNEYHSVEYRLELDYRGVLVSNIFKGIGYFAGMGLFILTKDWQWIYLLGFGGFYVYLILIKKSRIVFQHPHKTKIFSECVKDTVSLSGANVLARSINYADKILMYPIMGGSAVSVYYAATLLGKVVSLVITPINSVALSYLSRYTKRPDAIFKWTTICGGCICILGYVGAVVLGRPILQLLYPKYADEAMQFIFITSASVVIQVFTSIVTPFVIKFCSTIWQVIINSITVVIYVSVSLALVKALGLMGFCIGVLLANIVKLIITMWIYYKHSDSPKTTALSEQGG